ncbi:MAG TPA: CDP-diacylglycerol--serine O-phosphatidyltransferase [Syntrophorhabdaceae bacterium]|nr:CDP-diacylglycerol--serine O-phosphatidyltransferase [Syntrophorhabdaceae bacterium]HRR72088.1 CDP-diacylglycerol--serine O-phosphatidyltransferase [Syntrophorhabdaceae bacterium]HRV22968.1 CDP-diacylglycerol--serine O-phosphatidyltransferase [Syntrophorhabdaceae bacterium]
MRKKKGKGIYILPNLLTSISLLSGFYSIISTIDRKFIYASIAIFISGIFDMLDGRVARMTGSSSRFGVEYDSLCDLVAFGVAPGLLVYIWALKGYGRFGWLAAFLYVACGALRLARFNIQVDNVQKKHFLGLPIPAAAIIIAGSVLFYSWLGYKSELKTIVMPILVYILAFLMVSDVRYYSFKDMAFFKGKPFRSTLAVILLLVIIFIEPKVTLFVLAAMYLLSGPVFTLINSLINRKKSIPGEYPRLKEDPSERDGHL